MTGLEGYMSGHSGGHGHGGHGKGPKTIDDFLAAEGKKQAAEVDAAFEHYDAFTDDENVNKILMETLVPAHDKFYSTFSSQLQKIGDTSAKVHGKRKELESAVTSALKDYFKMVMPSALEALKGIPEDEHYDILTQMYDRHIIDPQSRRQGASIRALVENYAKNKNATVGEVLQQANQYRQQHPQGAYANLRDRIREHHFSKFHPHQVGGYLKGKLADYKLDVSDHTTFASHDIPGYLTLYEGIKTGRLPQGTSYDAFGVERTKAKKGGGHGSHSGGGHH